MLGSSQHVYRIFARNMQRKDLLEDLGTFAPVRTMKALDGG